MDENNIIKVQKGFIGKKINTAYTVKMAGEKVFKAQLDGWEKMIRQTK